MSNGVISPFLHNFISPQTGRILAPSGYVLMGNGCGIATPSSALSDLRLDFIQLRQEYNLLKRTDFVIGFPNEQLENAQVLSKLDNGFLYNTDGVIGTQMLPEIPPTDATYIIRTANANLPNAHVTSEVGTGITKLISGGYFAIATPSTDYATPDDISGVLDQLSDLANIVNAISNTVDALSSAVDAIETGLATIGGFAAIILLQAQVLGLLGAVSGLDSRLSDVEEDVDIIKGQIIVIQDQITSILASIAAINDRIDNLTVELVGDVTGSGLISEPIVTELQLTLDQIKLAQADVNVNNHKIINVSDPMNPLDAVNLQTLESNTAGLNITLVGEVTGTGPISSPISTELQLTLDQIKLAQDTVNINDHRVTGVNSNAPQSFSDAINLGFLIALVNSKVQVIWE